MLVASGMKDIPGYKGKYAATRDGRIWSHKKLSTGACPGGVVHHGRFLTAVKSTGGYFVVGLSGKVVSVHRIIAKTYLKRSTGRNHVNHKNGEKSDNRVENLEWCTQAENNRHAWTTGLCSPPRKITETQAKDILKLRRKGITIAKIAAQFHVGRATIHRVVHGTHGYGSMR